MTNQETYYQYFYEVYKAENKSEAKARFMALNQSTELATGASGCVISGNAGGKFKISILNSNML
jgi:hypothetical protein